MGLSAQNPQGERPKPPVSGTPTTGQRPPGANPNANPNGQRPPGANPNGQRPAPAIPGVNTANAATGGSKLSGVIVDSLSGKPVEFANIVLYRKTDNQLMDGTATDEKGKFSLQGVANGVYKMELSFLGFNTKYLDNIRIDKEQKMDLGNVKLGPSAKNLAEVTVTGDKSLVEEKVDRLIYNAEKDLTSKGGDAADILRKVPMLSVDLDGNVSLRGNGNVRVLINNKPSTIMAANIADALKQIPADMIKTVEVITSPSAKYDAEGSGGIINIITKKNTLQGYNMNVDLGVGNRGSNLGLRGSYRAGKMGFTLGGYGRGNYFRTITDLNQTTFGTTQNVVTAQNIRTKDNGLFGNYNLGWDYDIAKNQSLTASVRYGVRNSSRKQDQNTGLSIGSNPAIFSERLVDVRDLSGSIDVNLDYVHTYKPRQEWSISSQMSRNNLTNNFFTDYLNTNRDITGRQKNVNLNTNQEFTIQTDYQKPIDDRQSLEFGAKGIFREVTSNYKYLAADPTSDYTIDPKRPAGQLNYSQNVAAAYLSYTLTTKNKYTFKVGSRYEYTAINAKNQVEQSFNIPSYGILVPSVNVSKNLSETTTLKLGYNRRIQRPGLQQLNPNFNAANPQNITIGNPLLRPELTDNIELGLGSRIKKTYINVAIFGRITDNVITQIRQPSDTLPGAVISTYQNIGKQRAIGSNFFGNVYLTSKWTIGGGFDLVYAFLEGTTTGLNGLSQKVTNNGLNVNGRLMTQITLKNGWAFQGFSFMRGSQVQLQGRQGGFGFYSFGMKKDFNNKKASFGLSAENFFSRGITIRTQLNSPTFIQDNQTLQLNRGIRVNFSYTIGKMSFEDQRRKTRSVNNDDLKNEEGGGQQQGSGTTPAPARRQNNK
jgi:outer membrane receptor for ferrienterochelin and colicin/5-hydroxyisourate hydrolase-like protein (transthyretin family)